MSRQVQEIMNREVLMLREDETAEDALGYMVALGVSGAPVVDAQTRPIGVVSWRNLVEAPAGALLGARMTSPAVVVSDGDTITHAAEVLAEQGIHRLFVVDRLGAIVGALSTIDVLRAFTGRGVRHPAQFPHLDQSTGVAWTDDEPFELSACAAAPDGPGVLLLVENVAGETDDVALVEAPSNVRARLYELLSAPPSDRPELAHLLEHPSHLRFRAASIADARKRSAVARTIRAHASHDLRSASLR